MKVKHYKFLAVLLSTTLYSCSETPQENEFNLVCDYFHELKDLKNAPTMTAIQRNEFIVGKITQSMPPTSNARKTWETVSYSAPLKRYTLFKSSAESTLKKEWHCKSMQALATITGGFD